MTKAFNEAIRIMNWHLLPLLKFSPKELMLGMVVNTKPTNIDQSMLLSSYRCPTDSCRIPVIPAESGGIWRNQIWQTHQPK